MSEAQGEFDADYEEHRRALEAESRRPCGFLQPAQAKSLGLWREGVTWIDRSRRSRARFSLLIWNLMDPRTSA